MRSRHLDREPREQLGDDGRLVDPGACEVGSGEAPLDEQCAPFVVPRDEPCRATPRPLEERVRLVVRLVVRRRVELEDDLARRDDERPRRLERRLQREAPLRRALGGESG